MISLLVQGALTARRGEGLLEGLSAAVDHKPPGWQAPEPCPAKIETEGAESGVRRRQGGAEESMKPVSALMAGLIFLPQMMHYALPARVHRDSPPGENNFQNGNTESLVCPDVLTHTPKLPRDGFPRHRRVNGSGSASSEATPGPVGPTARPTQPPRRRLTSSRMASKAGLPRSESRRVSSKMARSS